MTGPHYYSSGSSLKIKALAPTNLTSGISSINVVIKNNDVLLTGLGY